MLGGAAWLPVPLGMATAMGLGAAALQSVLNLTPGEVSAGLPAPRAAAALMGKSGAQTMLVLLFLAVTSATSAELIAVSTLFTHDVFRTYINPGASDKQLLWVGHISVVVAAVMMGFLGLIFHYIGISMGWVSSLEA
jgi:Na+/proline symporter